jgi:hypothetical protein
MIFTHRSSAVKQSTFSFTHLAFGLLFSMLTGAITTAHAADRNICNPGNGTTGSLNGTWYSYYEGSSQNDVSNCDVKMKIYDDNGNHFRIDWDQNKTWGEDVVGGAGWNRGSDTRKIGYNIGQFDSNATQKAIAGVYGWTCGSTNRSRYPNTKAQEYYIVDTWSGGGTFVPWDENANAPATPIQKNGSDVEVSANGGTYKVYKVGRNGAQYCGNGSPRKFDQFWSVRTSKLAINNNRGIDFANHDNTWDNHGFSSSKVKNGYQIVMGESFGHANFRHKGAIDASVWSR